MRKKGKRYTTNILLIIFLGGMIYSGIQIFKWFKENNENKEIMENLKNIATVSKNKDGSKEYNIDFVTLKAKNPETVGWIKVNGTNIEHPVVQTTNNDFYLTHSFDKSYNSAGWIFLNCNNKLNSDKNITIFAHNRRDGSMFGTLKNILTKEWQDNSNNLKISFITENEKAIYQVFSVYSIENEDYYITTNFKDDKSYEEFLGKVKSRSEKNFGVEVTSSDKVLTLSTCANDNRYRVVLHAKKEINEK